MTHFVWDSLEYSRIGYRRKFNAIFHPRNNPQQSLSSIKDLSVTYIHYISLLDYILAHNAEQNVIQEECGFQYLTSSALLRRRKRRNFLKKWRFPLNNCIFGECKFSSLKNSDVFWTALSYSFHPSTHSNQNISFLSVFLSFFVFF